MSTLTLLTRGESIAFLILAIVALVSTYKMITSRLITHAALFMALCFTAVAGVFLLLEAEFVAAIQILIYTGAITTMIMFAIMLSGLREVRQDRQVGRPLWMKSDPLVLVVGGVFAAFMCYIYAAANLPQASTNPVLPTVSTIGSALFTKYVVPFEVASILLLIAMVGAIILTAKEAGDE